MPPIVATNVALAFITEASSPVPVIESIIAVTFSLTSTASVILDVIFTTLSTVPAKLVYGAAKSKTICAPFSKLDEENHPPPSPTPEAPTSSKTPERPIINALVFLANFLTILSTLDIDSYPVALPSLSNPVGNLRLAMFCTPFAKL